MELIKILHSLVKLSKVLLRSYTESKARRESIHLSKVFGICKVSPISQVETKEVPSIQIILKVILNSVTSSWHFLAYTMTFIA